MESCNKIQVNAKKAPKLTRSFQQRSGGGALVSPTVPIHQRINYEANICKENYDSSLIIQDVNLSFKTSLKKIRGATKI